MDELNIKYFTESINKINSVNKILETLSEEPVVNSEPKSTGLTDEQKIDLQNKLLEKKIQPRIISGIIRSDFKQGLAAEGLSIFYRNIDNIDLDRADDFYNNALPLEFKQVVNGIRPMGVGPGDVILSSLIRGAISGGTGAGDIIIIGGKVVDVKEMDSGNQIQIPFTSAYIDNTKLANAMSEMTGFFKRNEEKFDSVVKKAFLEGFDEKIKYDDFLEKMKSVFKKELSHGLFITLRNFISFMKEKYKHITIDSVKFVIGGEKTTLAVKNPQIVKQKIKNKSDTLDVDVEKLTNSSEHLIAKFLNMELCKNEYLLGEDMTKSLLENIKYHGMFILQTGGSTCRYYNKSEYLKVLEFKRITMGTLRFQVLKNA